jgi:hypothetical protein
MPDAHARRDENPCRKPAPHRLGKHPVLDDSTRGTVVGAPAPRGRISRKYSTCRLSATRSGRTRRAQRRGRCDTSVDRGKQGGIGRHCDKCLESLAVLSVLCVSAVSGSFLQPENLKDSPQRRRGRRGNRSNHESRSSSHCLYSSPPELHASGAASSKRVWRARNTKFSVPVGPLRCLAMMSSALARSSSGKSVL